MSSQLKVRFSAAFLFLASPVAALPLAQNNPTFHRSPAADPHVFNGSADTYPSHY